MGKTSKQTGLTLIELLATLAIVAILANISAPTFTLMLQDKQQDARLNDFKNSILITRSEAVKRGLPAVICATSNGVSCANTAWTDGWMSFVDENGNGSRDASEFVIRVSHGLDDGYSLVGTANVSSRIRYQSNGNALESGTVTLCDPRGAAQAQAIIVSPSGKPRVSESAAGGAALSCA